MNSIVLNSSMVPVKTDQSKGMLSNKILSKLKEELSEKDLISNIYDKRVMTLRDALLFDKGHCKDPESLLGEGWLEEKFYGEGRAFALRGENNDQVIVFERDTKRVSLLSNHFSLFCGAMQQEILMRRDGVVSY